jgi:hypothetical protein
VLSEVVAVLFSFFFFLFHYPLYFHPLLLSLAKRAPVESWLQPNAHSCVPLILLQPMTKEQIHAIPRVRHLLRTIDPLQKSPSPTKYGSFQAIN